MRCFGVALLVFAAVRVHAQQAPQPTSDVSTDAEKSVLGGAVTGEEEFEGDASPETPVGEALPEESDTPASDAALEQPASAGESAPDAAPQTPPTEAAEPVETSAVEVPQAAAASGSFAPAGEEGLEEIIVTAQKRPESIQKIPVSVVAMDGTKLSDLSTGGADIRFLSARMPSLTIESSFGRTFPRFYIRGLGNTDFDLNASQPVSMILDEVVLENPTLKGFPIFDVERVEVLRGPQGTLFGRNTPAGIIKFESRKPTQEVEGYGRLTYGQFNLVGLEAAASGPVIYDVLAARVSLLYERRDGWVDNSFTGEKEALEGFQDMAGRFQLLLTPNQSFRALANIHAHSLNGTARLFRANIIEPGTDKFVKGFKRGEVAQDGQNSQEINQLGLVLNMQYDFGRMTLTSITGYESINVFSRGDIDGGVGAIPFSAESADGIPSLGQGTQELRLSTNDWQLFNFQTGVFYFHEDVEIESFSYDTLNGGVQNGYAKQEQSTRAFALFASFTVDPIDDLRLAGGLRYTDDQKDFSAERLTAGNPLGPLTEDPRDDFVSWDASATYTLDPGINVFARVARGFRAPSIQGRILFGDSLSVADSEKILSFEGGVKSELFARRARINLAGFYYELKDQQLTAVGGAGNFNTLLNAKKSIGYGFELDTEVMPVAHLLISLGLSFNHTEIKGKNLSVVACGAPCTVTDEPADVEGQFRIAGNPLPHAPEWIGNATLRYDLPISDEGELFVFTDWAYRSRVNFFLYESKEYTDAYLLEGGLRLGYAHAGGRMELAGYVRNITNDESRTGGIDFVNLTGFVNEPRVFGAEGIFRF